MSTFKQWIYKGKINLLHYKNSKDIIYKKKDNIEYLKKTELKMAEHVSTKCKILNGVYC